MPRVKYQFVEVAPAVPLGAGTGQVFTYRVPAAGMGSKVKGQLSNVVVTVPFGKRVVSGVVLNVSTTKPKGVVKEVEVQSPIRLTEEQVQFARWMARTMQGGLGYTLRLFFPPSLKLPGASPPLAPSRGRDGGALLPNVTPLQLAVVAGDDSKRIGELAWLARILVQGGPPAGNARAGKQVLILVPEQALMGRIVDELRDNEVVALPYSADLRGSAAAAVWQRVWEGESVVVVGTQKALFLPWRHLGAVVVEQEAFETYKLWDQYPRLDGRLGAEQLARIHRSPIVWSGSFPSLRLAAEVVSSTYQVSSMSRSRGQSKVQSPPPLRQGSEAQARLRPASKGQGSIVPLVWEPLEVKTTVAAIDWDDRKERRYVPQEAVTKLKQWVKGGEKIFVLYQRKGRWAALVCRSCQQAVRCKQCGAAFTVQSKTSGLVCRSCGERRRWPKQCPTCRKTRLVPFGAGMDRVVELLREAVPGAQLLSIDASVAKLVTPQHLERAQIILGTTAAWRVLGETTIGRAVLLFPEAQLLFPDYRSEERTLLQLVRLQELLPARRAVLVVTRQRRLIQERLVRPWGGIYESLLGERWRLSYPPFSTMVRLSVSGKREKEVLQRAEDVLATLRERLPKKAQALGPLAGRVRAQGQFQAHVLLLGALEDLVSAYEGLDVDVVDVNPSRVV